MNGTDEHVESVKKEINDKFIGVASRFSLVFDKLDTVNTKLDRLLYQVGELQKNQKINTQ